MLIPLKTKIKNLIIAVRLLISMPMFWLSFIIFVLAVISLCLSKELNNNGSSFWSSVLSNIFAGLITGLVLSILSSSRTVFFSHLEVRHAWLSETHKKLLDFIKIHRKLLSAKELPNDDYSDLAYDALCHASWVNVRILQGTFDKSKWFDPPQYFLKHYNYDAMKMNKVLYDFRDFLLNADYSIKNRKNIIESFDSIYKTMFVLNHTILGDMKEIDIRLATAKKSIL